MRYTCSNCAKQVGQITLDKETKKWLCDKCYDNKDGDRTTKESRKRNRKEF